MIKLIWANRHTTRPPSPECVGNYKRQYRDAAFPLLILEASIFSYLLQSKRLKSSLILIFHSLSLGELRLALFCSSIATPMLRLKKMVVKNLAFPVGNSLADRAFWVEYLLEAPAWQSVRSSIMYSWLSHSPFPAPWILITLQFFCIHLYLRWGKNLLLSLWLLGSGKERHGYVSIWRCQPMTLHNPRMDCQCCRVSTGCSSNSMW